MVSPLRRRREGVRRHRAGDGKAARRSAPGSAGRASTPTWSRARTAPGCSWARSTRRSSCRPTRRTPTAAAPARAAWTPARPTPFPRPTGSMRRAASPTSPSSIAARSRTSSAPPMGNRIYGCDDCLAVCPWNRFARATREAKLQPRAGPRPRPRWPSSRRSTMPASARCFAGSPIKRIGRDRFVRNVLIAIGNSGDAALPPARRPPRRGPRSGGRRSRRLGARPPARLMLVKKSFALAGHRTSVALEPEFWAVLAALAASRDRTLSALVAEADAAARSRHAARLHAPGARARPGARDGAALTDSQPGTGKYGLAVKTGRRTG